MGDENTAPSQSVWTAWVVKFALVILGIGFALLMIELALRYLPYFQEDRRLANIDLGVIQFRSGMGDLFIQIPGWIAPPDDPYEVLSEHRLAWDDDGFRIPNQPADHYDVLALGDSFTEGANVALPWPDVLAQESGLAVRNMGFRGYGPFEELHVMEEYGAEYDARYVVIGFFGGNDLANAESYSWRPAFRLPELTRGAFAEEFDFQDWTFDYDFSGPFRFPLAIDVNGTEHDSVLLEGYVWELAFPYAMIAESEALQLTIQTWRDIDALTDACVVIAYLPSKEQIYLPYMSEEQYVGFFTYAERERHFADLDELVALMSNQRDVIRERAIEEGFYFVDTTPALEAITAEGEMPYYTYDTHVNQAGQQVIGSTIARYLETLNCARN